MRVATACLRAGFETGPASKSPRNSRVRGIGVHYVVFELCEVNLDSLSVLLCSYSHKMLRSEVSEVMLDSVSARVYLT